MKQLVMIGLLAIAMVPVAQADPENEPVQGTCVGQPDGTGDFPGYTSIVATKLGTQGGRWGARIWVPANENYVEPSQEGTWEYSGTCSLLDDIHRFIACELEADKEACDAPLDPNVRFFVA